MKESVLTSGQSGRIHGFLIALMLKGVVVSFLLFSFLFVLT